MEGYALELSCLALHRVWGAVPGGFTRHGFLSQKNNKNNKKTAMYKLSCSKPQKDEDNNDYLYYGMSRKTSRLLFGAY